MIFRASLVQLVAFQTNPSTSYHHDPYWTVQVQCFFRQTSAKFSLSFPQSLEGTTRSDWLCIAPCGTHIPEPAAAGTPQLHCWCVCPMPSLMGVPCAWLLNGPIIRMSHVKWNACQSHCSTANTSESYNLTKMQRRFKYIISIKRHGSYKRLIYSSKITSFSSTEAIFPEIISWSILEFIKRLVMSTRITIRWLSEGHPLSKWKNSESLSWFTAVTVTGYLCTCTWKHQYI